MSQLFGMDHIFTKMQDKYENQVNKKERAEKNANSFDTSKLSETSANYLEELKAKYGDAEIVVVSKDQANQASEIAANTKTDKGMVIVLTEDELDKMATNEDVRTKNESLIDEAMSTMPDVTKKLEESGLELDTFGMEIKDGIVNYFAVLEDHKKVSASSLDEFMKKLEQILYEQKADNVQTEQEKMVGQSFDFTV